MKVVFLDTDTVGNVDFSDLTELFDDVVFYGLTSDELVAERIKDVEIVITNKVRIGAQDIALATNLKLICVAATGYNNIDIKICKQHNIAVINARNYSTSSVVQHTFALAFGLLNRLTFFNSYMFSGAYSKSPHFSCFETEWEEVCKKTWGIIGLGTIGKTVANVAVTFGCNVVYYSVSGNNQNSDFKRLNLDSFLKTCDIISIHCPLSDLTKNLLNEDKIRLLKPNAVVVNIARGGIVDEYAIANAIREGRIGGYACDVFEQEPIREGNPLLELNSYNIILTPHIAWAGKQSRQALIKQIVTNIKAFINGEILNRVV